MALFDHLPQQQFVNTLIEVTKAATPLGAHGVKFVNTVSQEELWQGTFNRCISTLPDKSTSSPPHSASHSSSINLSATFSSVALRGNSLSENLSILVQSESVKDLARKEGVNITQLLEISEALQAALLFAAEQAQKQADALKGKTPEQQRELLQQQEQKRIKETEKHEEQQVQKETDRQMEPYKGLAGSIQETVGVLVDSLTQTKDPVSAKQLATSPEALAAAQQFKSCGDNLTSSVATRSPAHSIEKSSPML